LIVLEDRVAPSVTTSIFDLDPNASSLNISGTVAGSPILPQGVGSLTAHYGGTLVAAWDLTGHTLEFIPAGTNMIALISGVWQPLPGGVPGSAPANYGGLVNLFGMNVTAALRDLVSTVATSGPLPLSGGGPSYNFPSTQTLTITAGSADYNAGALGMGTANLAGNAAVNTATPGTFQDLGNGNYRVTAPVNVTITQTVAGQPAILHIVGMVVTNATIPVVDLSNGAVSGRLDYSTRAVGSQGPVHIADPAGRVLDTARNLTSMTVTLTNHPDGTNEVLAANVAGTGLSASYDLASGVLTITGSASPAVYQGVLRTLTYENRSATPDTHDRGIRVAAFDGRNFSIVVITTVIVTIVESESFNVFFSVTINVTVFVLIFRGDLIDAPNRIIPDQDFWRDRALTNPFATQGRTPGPITQSVDADGNTEVRFTASDPSQALTPGGGDYHGTWHFGLHGTNAGASRLQLLSGVGMGTGSQTETHPVPTVVQNPPHGDQFQWTTVFLNFGTTANDENGLFWNAPVPRGEAPNVSIVNVSGASFRKSNIRMGDPSDTAPDVETLQGDDFINGLHQIYGGPPIQVDPGSGTHFAISHPSTVTAGGSVSITVSALDAGNNPANSYTGTVHFSSSDPQAGLPADYTFTTADQGTHTFTVTLKTAGSQNITVADTAHSDIDGVAFSTVNPAAASTFQVAAVSTVTAGNSLSMTVTARDPYNNVATGYTGTVHFSSTDPQATLPADSTLINGTGMFSATLKTAGSQSITATDTVSSSLTGSAAVSVTPAAADHFAVTTSAANPDVAGTPFDATVTVQDAYNNTVPSYTGTVHFSSADPHPATLPADYTFQASDNGQHTFSGGATLYTAGTRDVTAADAANNLTGTTNVTVVAGSAVAFVLMAPATASSGTPFDVTILAVDHYGNTDTHYLGGIHFTATDSDPGVVLPPDYMFQPGDAGTVTFTGGVTLITQGPQTITVADLTSGITGSTIVTVL
jgi:hypothetical protein